MPGIAKWPYLTFGGLSHELGWSRASAPRILYTACLASAQDKTCAQNIHSSFHSMNRVHRGRHESPRNALVSTLRAESERGMTVLKHWVCADEDAKTSHMNTAVTPDVHESERMSPESLEVVGHLMQLDTMYNPSGGDDTT